MTDENKIPEEYSEKPNFPLSMIVIIGTIIMIIIIILLLYKTGKLP